MRWVALCVIATVCAARTAYPLNILRPGEPRIKFNRLQCLERATQGEEFTITAFITPLQNIWEDEGIFCHLLKPEAMMSEYPTQGWFQKGIAVNANASPLIPSQRWIVGEDAQLGPISFAIPADLAPGRYLIQLGLYYTLDPSKKVFIREPYVNREIKDWIVGQLEIQAKDRSNESSDGKRVELMLSDFESLGDVKRWESMRRGEMGLVSGSQALDENFSGLLAFPANAYLPLTMLQAFFESAPSAYTDWSQYDHLEFLIQGEFNPGAYDLSKVSIQVKDVGGSRFQRALYDFERVKVEPVKTKPPETPAWPVFHHDERSTGLSPYAGPSMPLLAWSYMTGDQIHMSSPALGREGNAYVGSLDNNIYSFNPTGTLAWSYRAGGDMDSCPAIGKTGNVHVGSNDANLYVLDSRGAPLWSYKAANAMKSPTLGSDGRVYAGAGNPLYAWNSSGSLSWSYYCDTADFGYTPPSLGDGGEVYRGSGAGACFYAWQSSGALSWSYRTNAYSSPAIDNSGNVYTGTYNQRLAAWNSSGSRIWSYETGEQLYSSPALGSDGKIYIGTAGGPGGAVYHFRVWEPSGSLSWSYAMRRGGSSSPALGSNGTVYAGGYDNAIYAWSSSGAPAWSYRTANRVSASPAIGSGGQLYVGSVDNTFYAIAQEEGRKEVQSRRNRNGEPVWRLRLPIGDIAPRVDIANIRHLGFWAQGLPPEEDWFMTAVIDDVKLVAEKGKKPDWTEPFIVFEGLECPATVTPGSALKVTADFTIARKFRMDYGLFIHIIQEKAPHFAIHLEKNPFHSTSTWEVGRKHSEGPIYVPIPWDAPPGKYIVNVGFYTTRDEIGGGAKYVNSYKWADGIYTEEQPTRPVDYIKEPYLNKTSHQKWTVGEVTILARSESRAPAAPLDEKKELNQIVDTTEKDILGNPAPKYIGPVEAGRGAGVKRLQVQPSESPSE